MTSETLETSSDFSKRAPELKKDTIAALLILAAVIIGYFPSLKVGFFDDDYSFMRNLYLYFNGNTELLGRCFTGVFMDNPRYGVHYRPFLFFPLAFEWLSCGHNIYLLHLLDLVWHFLNSFLVFLAGKSIFRLFQIDSLYAVSFWGAIFFALHPFHAEGVNFWCTNPDIFFSTWYLSCLIFFAKYLGSKKKSFLFLSLAMFLLAIGSKETAATLPLVLLTIALFSKTEFNKANIVSAVKDSLPFWLVLLPYWTLRAFFLHTLMGGYFGPLTSDWLGSFALRYLETNVFHILFYPVCQLSKFAPLLNNALAALYLTIGILLVKDLRSGIKKSPALRASSFTLAYFAIAMLPVCWVWCPSVDLNGTRILYLPILGLCWFLSLSLFALASPGIKILRQILAILLSAIFLASLFESHGRWLSASSYASSLIKQLQEKLIKSATHKVLLLTVPNRIAGVPTFCTYACMRDAYKAPFVKNVPWKNLDSMEPHYYGDSTLINIARLERLAKKRGEYLVYDCKLNEANRTVTLLPFALDRFLQTEAPARRVFLSNSFINSQKDTVTIECNPSVNTASYQFLKLKFRSASRDKKPGKLALYWKEAGEESFSSDFGRVINQAALDSNGEITVHTGEILAWLRCKNVDSIAITGRNAGEIESVSLYGKRELQPELSPSAGSEELGGGVILPKQGEFTLDYDASAIKDAAGIRVELTPPVTWLSFYTHTNADDKFTSHTEMTEYIDSVKGSFNLPNKLNSPIWQQIRIFAVDKNHRPLGFSSDALYIQSGRHPPVEGAQE